MAGLLKELMAAGLIEETGGDDNRLQKMEKAAAAVCQELIAKPSHVIGAMLAGLDPDIEDDDPALALADQALVSVWKTVRNVYPSTPKTILRAILLEACQQATSTKLVYAIVWLTAVDTLPLVRLGKQESIVRKMLDACAMRTEETALVVPAIKHEQSTIALNLEKPAKLSTPEPPLMDRSTLLLQIAGTVGNTYAKSDVRTHVLQRHNYYGNNRIQPQSLADGNPHEPGQGEAWRYEFADKMTTVLGTWLDFVAKESLQGVARVAQQLQNSHIQAVNALGAGFAAQQKWVQEGVQASDTRQKAERLRLDALWWSEALYSTPLRCSYRELPAELAAVVMAIDLLSVVTTPSPAGVAYLLSETVHRLPGAAFDQKRPVRDILVTLREQRNALPDVWRKAVSCPPRTGRLSLRDAIVSALVAGDWNPETIFARANIGDDIAMSLPVLSRALFRQEQAVRLAGGER